jgi:ubiquinone/menaquinone biosynthesis C-methylase UbiE
MFGGGISEINRWQRSQCCRKLRFLYQHGEWCAAMVALAKLKGHTVAMFGTRLARTSSIIVTICLALGTFASPLRAANAENSVATPVYREGRGSPDGIGKFYQGREIAAVMGFEGAPWLERPSRESEERPDLLVEELHLQSGMTVADIGAGSGYLSRRMAPIIGPGRVFAVDVQPQMVALLTELSRKPEYGNLVPIQGGTDDVQLPPASVDLAVMVDVYHELAYPYEMMQSLVRALKPGGRVVLVEYRAEDPAVPIKALHKMNEAQIRREMSVLPLTWERTSERLPMQHIVVFRKSVTGATLSNWLPRQGA